MALQVCVVGLVGGFNSHFGWLVLASTVFLGINRSIRLRHAAVWVCGLGKLPFGGTTQAVIL